MLKYIQTITPKIPVHYIHWYTQNYQVNQKSAATTTHKLEIIHVCRLVHKRHFQKDPGQNIHKVFVEGYMKLSKILVDTGY